MGLPQWALDPLGIGSEQSPSSPWPPVAGSHADLPPPPALCPPRSSPPASAPTPRYADFPHEGIPAGPVVDGVPTGVSVARQSFIAGAYCNVTSGNTTACPPWKPLVNVTLSGEGTIDGNGHNWWFATDAGSPAGRSHALSPVATRT